MKMSPTNKLCRILLLVVSCVVLSGCFDPDLSMITVLCDSAHPECPEGKVCDGKTCVVPSAPDLATDDMGQNDAGPIDMLGVACVDVSRVANRRAVLCRTKLVTVSASFACSQLSMIVCTGIAQIDLAKAMMTPGFFISTQPGDSLTQACGPAASSDRITFFGVGDIAGLPGIEKSSFVCSGLSVRTTSNTTTWSCSNASSVDSCFNFDSRQGVACCQP